MSRFGSVHLVLYKEALDGWTGPLTIRCVRHSATTYGLIRIRTALAAHEFIIEPSKKQCLTLVEDKLWFMFGYVCSLRDHCLLELVIATQ
jgi:hypothetical protein